jgi:hypothetical protein
MCMYTLSSGWSTRYCVQFGLSSLRTCSTCWPAYTLHVQHHVQTCMNYKVLHIWKLRTVFHAIWILYCVYICHWEIKFLEILALWKQNVKVNIANTKAHDCTPFWITSVHLRSLHPTSLRPTPFSTFLVDVIQEDLQSKFYTHRLYFRLMPSPPYAP